MLTHEQLLELLTYDVKTGQFFHKKNVRGKRIKAGDQAGYVDGQYMEIGIDRKYYKLHRLAWFYVTGAWPKNDIDHINQDGLDNRFENLREATRAQNRCNVGKTIKNTSGWKGVSWHRAQEKWVARIGVGKKRISLGYFEDIREAAEAYIFAALELHGEYARVE